MTPQAPAVPHGHDILNALDTARGNDVDPGVLDHPAGVFHIRAGERPVPHDIRINDGIDAQLPHFLRQLDGIHLGILHPAAGQHLAVFRIDANGNPVLAIFALGPGDEEGSSTAMVPMITRETPTSSIRARISSRVRTPPPSGRESSPGVRSP